MREIVCPVCGEAFTTSNAAQVYCSLRCRSISRREQRKKYKAPDYEAQKKPKGKTKTNGERIDAYALEAKLRHISYGDLQKERYLRKAKEG